MKRGLVLGLLVSVLSLSNVISGTQAPPAGPTPEALAATKIEKVKDNLYIITGSGADAPATFSGGNTAAKWGQDQMKAGKTVDQAAAEYKLPARYKGYKVTVNENFAGVKTNLQLIYNELRK